MTGKTHQMVGITAGVAWYLLANSPQYEPATFASVVVGSHLASLLPDMDSSASEIWHSLPFGESIGKIASSFLEHRNISHSLLGFGLVGLFLWWLIGLFPPYWGIDHNNLLIGCLIGYGSHLLCDAMTVEGIPLLSPYQRMMGIPPKPFDGVRIMTGKWFENLVIFPLVNLCLVGLIIWQWSHIRSIIIK